MYLKQSSVERQLGLERRLKLVVAGESKGSYQPDASPPDAIPRYLPLPGCPRIPPSIQITTVSATSSC